MQRRSVSFSLLFALTCTGNLLAQGCSDAGFCTMGAMKPDQPFNKKIELKLRSMEVSFYRGTTTLTPTVYVATADLNFSLNSKTSFQVKLPYQTVRGGSLGETGGLGDISICFTRNLYSTGKLDINLSAGGKIPTNSSDLSENGKPLPMYYQTSLGTYDFITGISLITSRWLIATGIQHPFNKNGNEFTWDDWPDYPDQGYILKYPQANKLRRGTDVMLRLERNFRYSRVNFSLGLLNIYRLNKDEIENPKTGETRKIDKTTGLALSGLFTAGYSFDVRNGIKMLLGHEIVQREKNADGLSRNFVSTISYYYRF
jgi:hypothetical protein